MTLLYQQDVMHQEGTTNHHPSGMPFGQARFFEVILLVMTEVGEMRNHNVALQEAQAEIDVTLLRQLQPRSAPSPKCG